MLLEGYERVMHEMSLMRSVIEIIETAAQTDGFSKVRRVTLEIGALASVVPEAMEFCFEAATQGTIAEGAKLEILTLPGRGWCRTCAREVEIAARYDLCPECGEVCEMIGGDQLRVKEVETD